MAIYKVIEFTDFDSKARCDLGGHLEAIMASDSTKMSVLGNMHMDIRVIKHHMESSAQYGHISWPLWPQVYCTLVLLKSTRFEGNSSYLYLLINIRLLVLLCIKKRQK